MVNEGVDFKITQLFITRVDFIFSIDIQGDGVFSLQVEVS